MRHTKSELYFHFVWATWERRPFVTETIERAVYRCIGEQVKTVQGTMLSIGGMPDHIHLIVRLPPNVSASQLMQKVKGVSSTFILKHLAPGEFFRWQKGYGVFTLSRTSLDKARGYVENQKQRHAGSKLWEIWEETDELVPDTENAPETEELPISP